jgi:hypothetical protein
VKKPPVAPANASHPIESQPRNPFLLRSFPESELIEAFGITFSDIYIFLL